MGYQNLFQRPPVYASCNWAKEEIAAGAPYCWWQPDSGGQGCTPMKLRISTSSAISVTPPSAAWWTGGNAGWYNTSINIISCGASVNNYLTAISSFGASPSYVIIDVMKALKDGIWSSSISFSTYASSLNSLSSGTAAIPNNTGVAPYGRPSVSVAITSVPTTSCTAGVLKTVTVYDDGRITVT